MTYLSYSWKFVPFNPSNSIFKLENETFLLFLSKLLSWISTPLMWLVLTQLSNVKNFVLPLNLHSCVSFIKPHQPPLPDLQQSLPASPALGNLTRAAGELQGVRISESSSTFVFLISTQNSAALPFTALLPPEGALQDTFTWLGHLGRLDSLKGNCPLDPEKGTRWRCRGTPRAGMQGPHVMTWLFCRPVGFGKTYTKL